MAVSNFYLLSHGEQHLMIDVGARKLVLTV